MVYLADLRNSRDLSEPATQTAVKIMRGGASAQNKESFLREACIQAVLEHPVRYHALLHHDI
jgi:hypothetical protein